MILSKIIRISVRSLSGVIALACASEALAQASPPRTNTYPVTGKILGSCILGQSVPFVLTTTIPANGKIDAALANVRWDTAGWTCNSASRISISARALRINTPRTSLVPSQSQTINFTARVSGWTTSEAVVTTGETTAIGTGALYTGPAQVQAAPKSGGLTIRVGNFVVADQKGSSNNNAKPIEGPYSATITITLAPNS